MDQKNMAVEIEIRAKTVDLAVEAAMTEFGVSDPDQLEVVVVTEPVKGFLGMGGQDAVVKVRRRKSRRNRGSRRKGRGEGQTGQTGNRQRGDDGSGKNGSAERKRPQHRKEPAPRPEKREQNLSDDRPTLTIEDQAQIANDFLTGLVEAYGLDGVVATTIEDDVIIADVSGEQTEALVGIRGSVRAAIHELTRTVLQKYAADSARLRLDIAGYAERRRQALSIYADQLIAQLMSEGGEIMLEPMSPADRKVIHDAAAAHGGVASYSEGEPPRRYVVLSRIGGEEEE